MPISNKPLAWISILAWFAAACGTGSPTPTAATVPATPIAPAPAAPEWKIPTLQSPELAWWRESMVNREARLEWFRQARFGMFIHWGVYSHAGGVWNGKPVTGYAEHLMRKQALSVNAYRTELADKFNPAAFDADAWVKAAKDAGMRYLIITAKHHDGFAMYDSAVSDFNVVKATPWKQDPMAALKQACAKQGLRFGFYYSHARDWTDGPVEDWDKSRKAELPPAAWARRYVDRKVIPQVQELIVKYDPDVFWFDTPEKLSVEENLRILRAAREAKPTLVVNGRAVQVGPGVPPARFGDYVSTTDKPAEFPPAPEGFPDWEAIPTTNESYGWHQGDDSHKPPAHFIALLAKAAARGGNVLLNIGPMGTGAFDPKDAAILEGIGTWMKVNGESIHGTTATPLPVQAWGESTRKGNTLYLHVLSWPAGGRLVIGGLKSKVLKASVLADPKRAPLKVEALGELDVLVRAPERAPDPVDTVIAVELDGEPRTDPARLLTADVQLDTLRAFDGRLAGPLGFDRGKAENAFVKNWGNAEGRISWPLRVRERATYDVSLAYDADKKSEGGTFQVAIGGKSFPGKVAPTPKNPVRVGRVTLEPGAYELVVSATKIMNATAGGELFRLRSAQMHFVQRGPSPSFDGLAANWGYQDCDEKAIQYPYPDDPGDGFPPGSCPPPASLKIECAGGSKIKVAAADASTWEKGFAHPPQYAIDDHLASRWSSHYTDDQWLTLDLGKPRSFQRLYLTWELARAADYAILTSTDGKRWTTVHTERDSDGFVDVLDVKGRGRYLKIQGLKRAKVGGDPLYGYSLFDVTICGRR